MDNITELTDRLWGLTRRCAFNRWDRSMEWEHEYNINGEDVWLATSNVIYTAAFLAMNVNFVWFVEYDRSIVGVCLKILCMELVSRDEPVDLALVMWTAYSSGCWILSDFTGNIIS